MYSDYYFVLANLSTRAFLLIQMNTPFLLYLDIFGWVGRSHSCCCATSTDTDFAATTVAPAVASSALRSVTTNYCSLCDLFCIQVSSEQLFYTKINYECMFLFNLNYLSELFEIYFSSWLYIQEFLEAKNVSYNWSSFWPLWFGRSEFAQRLPLCVLYEATNQGIQTVLYHRLIAGMAFLHAVRPMSLDSWALGCPGSGNILFQRRMKSFF